jgi:hypothetical protein
VKDSNSYFLTFFLILTFSLLGLSRLSAGVLADGANRLVDLQADITADNAGNGLIDDDPDDGGWDWYILPTDTAHTSSPSPDNLYGVTANGILEGFIAEGGIRAAIGLVDTYLGMDANPDVNKGPDYGFLVRLSDLTGDPTYQDLARDRWDTKMATYGGADSLAMLIRDSRHDQGWDALIPWDIGLYIESAMELQRVFPGQGYLSDAIDMADVIYEDLASDSGYFDMNNDSTDAYYLGLEGIVVSFGLTNVYTSYATDAGRIILANQNQDGSWPWSALYPDPDIQTTAYVVMAFGMLNLPYNVVNTAGQAGSDYLVSVQGANGGWDNFGYEYPEVDGECLRAISYYPPTSNLTGSSPHRLAGQGEVSGTRHLVPIIRPWSE